MQAQWLNTSIIDDGHMLGNSRHAFSKTSDTTNVLQKYLLLSNMFLTGTLPSSSQNGTNRERRALPDPLFQTMEVLSLTRVYNSLSRLFPPVQPSYTSAFPAACAPSAFSCYQYLYLVKQKVRLTLKAHTTSSNLHATDCQSHAIEISHM